MPAAQGSLLGSLYWRITGDDRPFRSSIERTETRARSASRAVQQSFNQIGMSFQRVGRQLTTFVTLPLAGIGALAIKNAADFEQQQVAFETFLGSAERARDLLGQIEAFSARTPFQFPGLVDAATQLLGVGVAAEDVTGILRNLGNASRGQAQIMDRLVDAFSKLRARGRASMEEINRFTEAGVPLIRALADRFEITNEELFKFVEQGKVGFTDVAAALEDLTTEGGQFAGLIEDQAETLSGMLSTLRDNIGLLLKDFGEEFIPLLKDAAGWLTELVQDFRNLSSGTRRTIAVVVGLTAAIGPLTIALGTMSKLIAANPYLALAGAIAGIVIQVAAWVKVQRELRDETKQLLGELERTTSVIDEQALALARASQERASRQQYQISRTIVALQQEREGIQKEIEVRKEAQYTTIASLAILRQLETQEEKLTKQIEQKRVELKAEQKIYEEAIRIIAEYNRQQKEGADAAGERGEAEGDAADITIEANEEADRRARQIWERHASVRRQILDREIQDIRDARDKEAEIEREAAEKRLATIQSVYDLAAPIVESLGYAITQSSETWEVFKNAAKSAIAGVLEMLARLWATEAAAMLVPGLTFNPAGAIGLFAQSAAALVAAGVVRSLREGGSFVAHGTQLIAVGDNTSRREQITATPLAPGQQGGEMIHVTVRLDGAVLADSVTRLSRSRRVLIDARSVV